MIANLLTDPAPVWLLIMLVAGVPLLQVVVELLVATLTKRRRR